jgi:hypothetical protein
MTKKLKHYSWKKFIHIFEQKLQFTYLWAFIKDGQATGEAFSAQKRISKAFKT